MKTVNFELDCADTYLCSKPGDQSGEYVPMEAVKALVDALEHIAMGEAWNTADEMAKIAQAALKAVEEA